MTNMTDKPKTQFTLTEIAKAANIGRDELVGRIRSKNKREVVITPLKTYRLNGNGLEMIFEHDIVLKFPDVFGSVEKYAHALNISPSLIQQYGAAAETSIRKLRILREELKEKTYTVEEMVEQLQKQYPVLSPASLYATLNELKIDPLFRMGKNKYLYAEDVLSRLKQYYTNTKS